MASKKYNTKGTPKQDLAAAKAELAAARQQLKQFRHDVAVLKRKGILDKKIYDARKVEPSKYLKSQIKKFDAILKGEAQAVKVSKAQQAEYKAQGLQIKNGRVIVPKQKNETVRVTKAGFKFTTVTKSGKTSRWPVTFDRNDPHAWESAIEKFGHKLKDGEALAFQFFGNNSHAIYHKDQIDVMLQTFKRYESVEKAEQNGSADEYSELIENLVLFKFERNENGKFERPAPHITAEEFDAEKRSILNARQRNRRARRMAAMPEKALQRFLDEKADKEKARRAAMTPEQKEAYRKKSRERAAKARAKKK